MSLTAGVMTIFLEKDWFKNINDTVKVPVYGIMGASYSFIIVYILVDLLELLKE